MLACHMGTESTTEGLQVSTIASRPIRFQQSSQQSNLIGLEVIMQACSPSIVLSVSMWCSSRSLHSAIYGSYGCSFQSFLLRVCMQFHQLSWQFVWAAHKNFAVLKWIFTFQNWKALESQDSRGGSQLLWQIWHWRKKLSNNYVWQVLWPTL